jgi:nitrate reductase gamma subunit
MLPLAVLPLPSRHVTNARTATACDGGSCACAAHAPRRRWEIAAGVFSVGLWAIVPKCPMCLAAHVAIWSGLGLSLAAATLLRWSLLGLCGAVLAGAIFFHWRRVTRPAPAAI